MKKLHLSTLFLLLLCIISLITCKECNSAYKYPSKQKNGKRIRTVSIADIKDKAEKTGITIDIDKEEVIDLTKVDKHGTNILHHAIFHKESDIQLVKFLLEELADKYPSKLEKMLNQLNPMGETPFMLAIQQRNVELIELLIDYGAKPTQRELIDAFLRAISSGDVNLVKYVMKLGKKIPLTFNLHILQLVVNSPVDHSDLVEYILEKTDFGINDKDEKGNTVLHNAILKGSETTVTVLLNKRHPDVNVQNAEGKTPLLLAIEKGSSDMVKNLIKNGAKLSLNNCNLEESIEFKTAKQKEEAELEKPIDKRNRGINGIIRILTSAFGPKQAEKGLQQHPQGSSTQSPEEKPSEKPEDGQNPQDSSTNSPGKKPSEKPKSEQDAQDNSTNSPGEKPSEKTENGQDAQDNSTKSSEEIPLLQRKYPTLADLDAID